jgi:hypothetical protein
VDDGIKYLGFNLKPNDYRKADWIWLLGKLEKRLHLWSHRWLSRAGRLVLVKYVLEAISRFIGCHSLGSRKEFWKQDRRICFKFLEWQEGVICCSLGQMGKDSNSKASWRLGS